MPSRNVSKPQVPQSYYHVYARGSNKQKIFTDVTDYRYFLKLLQRYLGQEPTYSKTGEPYPNFHQGINLLAYCLMGNHFHLLIYQIEVPHLEKFMRSLMTSYSRYFNLRHHRTGPLFESRYKAVRIESESHLEHISRYIHLNPRYWENYKFSSLKHYRDGTEPEWLTPAPILDMFASRSDYIEFVRDYESMRDMLQDLKTTLADS